MPYGYPLQAGLCAATGVATVVSYLPPNYATDEERARAKQDTIGRNQPRINGIFTMHIRPWSILAVGLGQAYFLSTLKDPLPERYLRAVTVCNALAVAGGALRWWCFRTLGKFFTFKLAIRDDHRLITTGPYKFLAHPSYTGMLLLGIASSPVFEGPLNPLLLLIPESKSSNRFNINMRAFVSIAITLVSVARLAATPYYLFNRVRDEEELMRGEFGEQYDEFLSRRWRLIPFIW